MKKNPKLEARRKKVPSYVKKAIDKSFAIAEQIDIVLKKKGLNQKQLADLLGKSESEISKWMSGVHNFTQTTIAKIEDKLGESITVCPKDVQKEYSIFVFRPEQAIIVKAKLEDADEMNELQSKFSFFTASSQTDAAYPETCFAQLN